MINAYNKRFLFICSSFPLPIDDGIKKIVSALVKSALSESINITLIVPYSNVELEYQNKIKIIYYNKLRTFTSTFTDLFKLQPLYFSLYFDKEVMKKIDINDYDVIFYDFYPMTQYSSGFKNEIFMMPDSMKQLAYSNFKNEKNIIRKVYSFVNYLLSARYNTTLNNVKKLYVSKEDIENDNLKNSYYFKIPMDSTDLESYQNNKYVKNELLFRGVMSFEPNVTAVEKFYNDIFLGLVEIYPSVIFKIVGKDPSKKLQDSLTVNTLFTGFVDDMMDVMSKSGIHIAPIYSGTGVKTKIIDSIALKRLVMTTPKGINGVFDDVEEARENGVIVFEDRDDFLRQYDDILNDRIDYKEMVQKAYDFLSQETYAKKINELFDIAKRKIL